MPKPTLMETSSAQAPAGTSAASPDDACRRRYDRFMEWLRDGILRSSRADDALLLAAWHGAIRSDNFDGVYFDDAVEEKACELYAAENAAKIGATRAPANGGVALIASTLFDTGRQHTHLHEVAQARPLELRSSACRCGRM